MPLNLCRTTLAVLMSAADPYTGTWTLDLARPGGESRSQTLTIEVRGNQERYRSELVWTTWEYDGKEHPSQTVVHESSSDPGTVREDTVVLVKTPRVGGPRAGCSGQTPPLHLHP